MPALCLWGLGQAGTGGPLGLSTARAIGPMGETGTLSPPALALPVNHMETRGRVLASLRCHSLAGEGSETPVDAQAACWG